MPLNDEKAAEFYADPENRETTGRAHRLPRERRLTSHVPVRFRPETIARVQVVADDDGKTVSSWIRSVVERELQRRLPPKTVGPSEGVVKVNESVGYDKTARTETSGAEIPAPT